MSMPARIRIHWLPAAAALALLLWPIAVAAQTGAGFQIAGRLVNSATGDPVPHATVSALSEVDNHLVASAITDAEGRFSIAGLTAGKYPLTASRRGYRTAYYDEHEDSFNTAVVTGPDQDTTHLVFNLAPGAVIYGAITGDGGDPVQNAAVLLFRRDPSAPSQHPLQMPNTTTDDIGEYEFSGLPAGEYFIAVQARPWYARHGSPQTLDSIQNELDVAYPITYFDSTTEEGAATPLAVDAGSRTEANISLHAVPALHLTLPRSHRNHNGPEIEMRQTVFGSQINMPLDVQSIARGPWDVSGLAPGSYELHIADPPRTVEVNAASSMEIDPASSVPTQPVDGTVRMADGSPPIESTLTLAHTDTPSGMLYAEAQNGKFHFPAVPPGTWMLSAGSASTVVYVAAVTVAGNRVPADQVPVSDHPVSLAVTLSRSQTQITGFARKDAKPAPGAMIILVPQDPAAWPALARRDQSDSDGSFSLSDVPPGRYTVIAIDGWNLDWKDRTLIARYLRGGQNVTIGIQSGKVVPLSQPVQTASP